MASDLSDITGNITDDGMSEARSSEGRAWQRLLDRMAASVSRFLPGALRTGIVIDGPNGPEEHVQGDDWVPAGTAIASNLPVAGLDRADPSDRPGPPALAPGPAQIMGTATGVNVVMESAIEEQPAPQPSIQQDDGAQMQMQTL